MTAMDRRKRKLLDEPSHLNQWGEIARARSEIARKMERRENAWLNLFSWCLSYLFLIGLLAILFWLISKAH